jgi:hypothetical protein
LYWDYIHRDGLYVALYARTVLSSVSSRAMHYTVALRTNTQSLARMQVQVYNIVLSRYVTKVDR